MIISGTLCFVVSPMRNPWELYLLCGIPGSFAFYAESLGGLLPMRNLWEVQGLPLR